MYGRQHTLLVSPLLTQEEKKNKSYQQYQLLMWVLLFSTSLIHMCINVYIYVCIHLDEITESCKGDPKLESSIDPSSICTFNLTAWNWKCSLIALTRFVKIIRITHIHDSFL